MNSGPRSLRKRFGTKLAVVLAGAGTGWWAWFHDWARGPLLTSLILLAALAYSLKFDAAREARRLAKARSIELVAPLLVILTLIFVLATTQSSLGHIAIAIGCATMVIVLWRIMKVALRHMP